MTYEILKQNKNTIKIKYSSYTVDEIDDEKIYEGTIANAVDFFMDKKYNVEELLLLVDDENIEMTKRGRLKVIRCDTKLFDIPNIDFMGYDFLEAVEFENKNNIQYITFNKNTKLTHVKFENLPSLKKIIFIDCSPSVLSYVKNLPSNVIIEYRDDNKGVIIAYGDAIFKSNNPLYISSKYINVKTQEELEIFLRDNTPNAYTKVPKLEINERGKASIVFTPETIEQDLVKLSQYNSSLIDFIKSSNIKYKPNFVHKLTNELKKIGFIHDVNFTVMVNPNQKYIIRSSNDFYNITYSLNSDPYVEFLDQPGRFCSSTDNFKDLISSINKDKINFKVSDLLLKIIFESVYALYIKGHKIADMYLRKFNDMEVTYPPENIIFFFKEKYLTKYIFNDVIADDYVKCIITSNNFPPKGITWIYTIDKSGNFYLDQNKLSHKQRDVQFYLEIDYLGRIVKKF